MLVRGYEKDANGQVLVSAGRDRSEIDLSLNVGWLMEMRRDKGMWVPSNEGEMNDMSNYVEKLARFGRGRFILKDQPTLGEEVDVKRKINVKIARFGSGRMMLKVQPTLGG